MILAPKTEIMGRMVAGTQMELGLYALRLMSTGKAMNGTVLLFGELLRLEIIDW